jgi:hypothetical protein
MNTPYISTTQAKHKIGSWVETYARIGIAAKGVVYILVGVLAAMAVFGLCGQTGGKQDAFRFVLEQPFGQLLLGLIILGLLGYVSWRFIQAFKNPENKKMSDRIGFFASGVAYLLIAIAGAGMLIPSLSNGSSSSGGQGNETLAAKILEQPFGQVLLGIVAAIVIGKGVYQVYRAISGKFKGSIQENQMSTEERHIYMRTGRVGYLARGVVFGILGYFLVLAATQANASRAGGTGDVFSFLSSNGGPYVLAIVAIGLACYGIFMFVKSRYRYIPNIAH